MSRTDESGFTRAAASHAAAFFGGAKLGRVFHFLFTASVYASCMATKKPEKYQNLQELLLLKLKVLHDVENQLIKALPRMAKASEDPALRQAFESHLEETRGHEERVDEALELMGDKGKQKEKSDAIRGLIKDADWCVKNIKKPEARDAALIAAAQYVEHYETAGYGSALEWAKEIGQDQVADLLEKTLEEEKAANDKLTGLAEGGINRAANDKSEDDVQMAESMDSSNAVM